MARDPNLGWRLHTEPTSTLGQELPTIRFLGPFWGLRLLPAMAIEAAQEVRATASKETGSPMRRDWGRLLTGRVGRIDVPDVDSRLDLIRPDCPKG